jgi:hypothetical protein
MMPRARQPLSLAQAAPLLVAPELAALDRLEQRRDDLKSRIKRLQPRAHRRLILEHELVGVVGQILRLELAIYRRGA